MVGAPNSAGEEEQDATMPEAPWKSLAHEYLRSRAARHGLAHQSRKNYAYTLTDFTDFLTGRNVRHDTPAPALAVAVDTWLESRGWSATTCCTNLGIVRPFLDWCGTRGLITAGVPALLRNPRRPRLLPRAQSTSQVSRLLAHVPDRRGRAIVLLMAQAGLRRAEVSSLTMGDVDLAEGAVLVHGKGGKERVVYLSDETVDAVRSWLVERTLVPGALISSYEVPGKAVTPTWVGILVVRWMRDAGLKTMPNDGMSGHALRHSAATNMLRNGANIRVVQEALGHESITTTARYLRADNDEVRQAMQNLNYGSRRLRAVKDS